MSEPSASAPAAPAAPPTSKHHKPLPHAHAAKNASETFAWIEHRLSEIYTDARISARPLALAHKDYLAIYNAVHSFCIATKCFQGSKNSGQIPNAESLYRCLEREAKRYCTETRAVVLASVPESGDGARSLVEGYLAQWNKYARLAAIVGHLMRFLDRHWIRRHVAEGKAKDIYSIQDLHKIAWKEEVLRVSASEIDVTNGAGKIVEAVIILRQRSDAGDESVRELLEMVTTSWASLALNMERQHRLTGTAGEEDV